MQTAHRQDRRGGGQGEPDPRQGEAVPGAEERAGEAAGVLDPRAAGEVQGCAEGEVGADEEDEGRAGERPRGDEPGEVRGGPHQERDGQDEERVLLAARGQREGSAQRAQLRPGNGQPPERQARARRHQHLHPQEVIIMRKMDRSAVRDARLNVEEQLEVLGVFGLQVEGLADGQLGVEVVLLDVEADCEVVVRLVVVLVQPQGLLVVVDGLFVDGDREVGVGQVLEQEVLLPALQAALEDHDGLGVSPEDVERCGLVVAQQQ